MNVASKIKNRKLIKSQNMLSSLKTDTRIIEEFMNINESESNWDFDNAESNNYAQNRKSVLIKKNNQVVDYLEN